MQQGCYQGDCYQGRRQHWHFAAAGAAGGGACCAIYSCLHMRLATAQHPKQWNALTCVS